MSSIASFAALNLGVLERKKALRRFQCCGQARVQTRDEDTQRLGAGQTARTGGLCGGREEETGTL